MANAFNKYFCEISNQIYAKNTKSNSVNTNNDSNFEKYLGKSCMNSFFFADITQVELIAIVKKLKPSTNCIGNCLSATLLKDIIEHIAEPLQYVCNLSFEKGIFPETLKLSKVIPLFKKGNKQLLNNYRPISLTNVVGKILEKAMHARMVSFFG